MPDWDADSPQLHRNLVRVLEDTRRSAQQSERPTVEMARRWHSMTMQGLDAPREAYVGRFRGEAGLEKIGIRIGAASGTSPGDVAASLQKFEVKLQGVLAALDEAIFLSSDMDEDGLAAVIDAAAWAHAEWVRIHPFANGNGRTARNWANFVFMRYNLPPVVRARPRPGGGYAYASACAMRGEWVPTALVFREMLADAVSDPSSRASDR